MPLPEFTETEQYLIDCARSPAANQQSNSYMWGYLLGGTLFAGFGAFHESIAMLLTAFAVVCGFRIYEHRFQSRWTPHWRTIISKFEAACVADSKHDADEG